MRYLIAVIIYFLSLILSPLAFAEEPSSIDLAIDNSLQISTQVAASQVSTAVEKSSEFDYPAKTISKSSQSNSNNGLSSSASKKSNDTALAVRIVVILTTMALIPAMLVSLTAFLRIIIVLSMLRHAIGLQETPPNTALIGLALFLTIFTMSPVLQSVNKDALQPFMQGEISIEAAYEKGSRPLREFMIRQTREQDLALMVELSKSPIPHSIEDVSNIQLVPAFMLSELRTAFQIGFVIFLPFLLVDLLVSSILMALGMMMMPPVAISLPLKILMFVLVDGWAVLLKGLIGSFH